MRQSSEELRGFLAKISGWPAETVNTLPEYPLRSAVNSGVRARLRIRNESQRSQPGQSVARRAESGGMRRRSGSTPSFHLRAPGNGGEVQTANPEKSTLRQWTGCAKSPGPEQTRFCQGRIGPSTVRRRLILRTYHTVRTWAQSQEIDWRVQIHSIRLADSKGHNDDSSLERRIRRVRWVSNLSSMAYGNNLFGSSLPFVGVRR